MSIVIESSQSSSTRATDTERFGYTNPYKARNGNFIGGQFVEPQSGQYFENITPITGNLLCQIPRSNEQDINAALDAAHKARDAWGKTSPTERALALNKIADIMEANTVNPSAFIRIGINHR